MKEKPPHLVLNLKRTEILDRLLTNIFPVVECSGKFSQIHRIK